MTTVLLIIHLLLAIALVGIVLMQRSEGGALGMGGGGMGGFMTGRATANLLTRTTAVIAACFMFTSLLLAILANQDRGQTSILEKPRAAPTEPAKPSQPTVPLAK
jgi:preprotein translocase subunit SecG